MAKKFASAIACLLIAAACARPLAAADPNATGLGGGNSTSGEPAFLPPDQARPLKWGPRSLTTGNSAGGDDEEGAAGGADGDSRWQPPRTSTAPRPRSKDSSAASSSAPRKPAANTGDGAADNRAVENRSVDRRARRASAEGAATGGGAEALMAQAYERSTTARDEAGYNETIEFCKEALQAGPAPKTATYARRLLAWGFNKRGETRLAAGNEGAALEDFEAAVAADKTCWRALHNRGVSYASLGRTREAVDDFSRTIELSRDFGMAYFNRGETRCELGDFASALEDYDMAARLSPKDAAVYNSRGYAHYRLRQLGEALADFDKAVELNPQNAGTYTNRGDVYAETGAYAEAAADYKEAIRLDRKSGRAYQSVAWLMATCPDDEFRNGELAVKAAQRAIALDGRDDYRYLATLAAAQAAQGSFVEAQRNQQAAIQIAPDESRAVQQRRLTLYQSEKPYRTPRHEAVAERLPQMERSAPTNVRN
jgi:tetratricopeptide (TPR) repeat protein